MNDPMASGEGEGEGALKGSGPFALVDHVINFR